MPGMSSKMFTATLERDRIERGKRDPGLKLSIRAEWKRVKKGEISEETALDNIAKLMEAVQAASPAMTAAKNNSISYLP